MKPIHPFIKGLLLMSLLLTLLNVVTMFIPSVSDAAIISGLLDVTLYTTFLLTVLGIFHTIFFLLDDNGLEDLTVSKAFFLLIPLINIFGILFFLQMLLLELGKAPGLW